MGNKTLSMCFLFLFAIVLGIGAVSAQVPDPGHPLTEIEQVDCGSGSFLQRIGGANPGYFCSTRLGGSLESVSNPQGNIDLIGQGGISITGDDAANTITIDLTGGTGVTSLEGLTGAIDLVPQGATSISTQGGNQIVISSTDTDTIHHDHYGVIGSGGLRQSGNNFGIETSGCSNGQVMKFDGTNWGCANDDSGSNVWNINGAGINWIGGSTQGVGIGTSAPSGKLHVAGGFNAPVARIYNSDFGASSSGLLISGQGGGPSLLTEDGVLVGSTATGDLGTDKLKVYGGRTRLEDRLSVAGDTFIYGGLHVGGPEDPGTDDLIVDGKLGVGGDTGTRQLTVHGLTGTSGSSSKEVRYFTSSGNFYYWSSSKRYKDDIQPFTDDFYKILQIEPKSFIDKSGEDPRRNIGYIAEEFDELGLNYLVGYDSGGRPDSLEYDKISLYLVEIVKDQQETIENQQIEIEQLKEAFCGLNPEAEVCKSGMY